MHQLTILTSFFLILPPTTQTSPLPTPRPRYCWRPWKPSRPRTAGSGLCRSSRSRAALRAARARSAARSSATSCHRPDGRRWRPVAWEASGRWASWKTRAVGKEKDLTKGSEDQSAEVGKDGLDSGHLHSLRLEVMFCGWAFRNIHLHRL